MSDQIEAVAKEDVTDEEEVDEIANVSSEDVTPEASVESEVLAQEEVSEDDEADESGMASPATVDLESGVEAGNQVLGAGSSDGEESTAASSLDAEPAAIVDAEVVTQEEAAEESERSEPVPADGDKPDASIDGTAAEAQSAEAEPPPNGKMKEAEDGGTRVRLLSVGQQIDGVVKRITDFGAFVDIGVGRDGLIHISELSVRRVGKVSDVLSEGLEITAWIKKLDRERNRISLTLIDPSTRTIRDLEKGEIVEGSVTRILPYGAFVDIGIGRDALLHVREMGEGYVAKPEDVVQVGEKIEARVIELSRRRGRVDLSLKGLRPEPEPEPAPPSAEAEEVQDDETPEDSFEEVEVLSPMELAFKKAMEAEDSGSTEQEKKQEKRNRRSKTRSIEDDIAARTLTTDRK